MKTDLPDNAIATLLIPPICLRPFLAPGPKNRSKWFDLKIKIKWFFKMLSFILIWFLLETYYLNINDASEHY